MQRVQVEVDGLRAWIYQRTMKSGATVWYVDVADPGGKRRFAVTRSLKTSSKTRAIDAAKRLLRSRQVLALDGGIEYLADYWDFDKSRRLKALQASGRAPGLAHVNNMRQYVVSHVIPWLRANGVERLQQINYSICQDLMNYLADNFAPNTVVGFRTALNQPLQQAVREELIAANPLRETEPPRSSQNARREHIPWPKLEKILKPGRWTSRKAYVGALLSVSTGMRSGELVALLWRHVDLDHGIVDVVHSWDAFNGCLKAPKNGKPRYGLRLPALVVDELTKMRKPGTLPDDFVFSGRNPGQPYGGFNFLRHLREAAKRAGVELTDKQTFHSLRHSAVSYGLAAGQDRARREALLQMAGHADASTQAIYTHTTEAELDAIAREWDERFSKIG